MIKIYQGNVVYLGRTVDEAVRACVDGQVLRKLSREAQYAARAVKVRT